jgi:maleate isomerase
MLPIARRLRDAGALTCAVGRSQCVLGAYNATVRQIVTEVIAISESTASDAQTQRKLLGMLTPSSNTVLEPVTTEMLAGLAEVSAHFSRFPVTEISLSQYGLGQFEHEKFLAAAALLGDAKMDAIAWNGTSAGWLGFEHDDLLCRGIEETTGARATTSILANVALFRRHKVRRFGLVTPYTDDVQSRIIDNFSKAGFECVSEVHLGISDNFSFSEVSANTLCEMTEKVAESAPDGIAIICTNLRAAPLVDELEAPWGIPMYDSIAVVVHQALELAGVDVARVKGWGRIFQM